MTQEAQGRGRVNKTRAHFNPIHLLGANFLQRENIYWDTVEGLLKGSNTQTRRHTHPASGDAPTDGDNSPLSGPD